MLAATFFGKLTVRLGVKNGRCTFSLGQDSQVVIYHALHGSLRVVVVKGLEIDESVAHLSVVRASGCLKLYLNIVHHDDLLAGHCLLHQWIFSILKVILLLQVGEA